MRTIRLNEDAKDTLLGKKVIAVGDDYIQLDNGTRIYLDEYEIDMLGGEPTSYKFARVCDVSGEGMNSGWVFEDSMKYAKTQADALSLVQDLGYNCLLDAYNSDVCYYTEWPEVDPDEWYVCDNADGKNPKKVYN